MIGAIRRLSSMWVLSLTHFVLSTDCPERYFIQMRECDVNVTTRSNLRNVTKTRIPLGPLELVTGTRSKIEKERGTSFRARFGGTSAILRCSNICCQGRGKRGERLERIVYRIARGCSSPSPLSFLSLSLWYIKGTHNEPPTAVKRLINKGATIGLKKKK